MAGETVKIKVRKVSKQGRKEGRVRANLAKIGEKEGRDGRKVARMG